MSNATVTGKVTHVIRHGHTVNGNPMVSVTLDSGETYRVSNDAMIAYGIENREFRERVHTFALTKSGRISYVVRD